MAIPRQTTLTYVSCLLHLHHVILPPLQSLLSLNLLNYPHITLPIPLFLPSRTPLISHVCLPHLSPFLYTIVSST